MFGIYLFLMIHFSELEFKFRVSKIELILKCLKLFYFKLFSLVKQFYSSRWSSYFCTSICGGPQEYIAYELVLASPAVSRVSGSSNLYSFRDGGKVSV